MATMQLPPTTFDTFDGGLPIILIPPSDEPQRSPATRLSQRQDQEMMLPQRTSRAPEPPAHAHPIPLMQDAFNESLVEATGGTTPNKPKLRQYDAKTRRDRLIAQEKDEEAPSMRWRYRPGQQQHELFKLMSQISFGMYLLLKGMANSDDQVVTIIQGHIDEIDEFLEVALEDYQCAIADLTERIEYLRLPLEHPEVFEKVLEDRNYRSELIQNNEVIEHILARTSVLMEQYEKDVAEGLRSTNAFIAYLSEQKDSERRVARPDVADIYDAMKGNTDGWGKAFADLRQQAKKLDSLVVDLSAMIAEMQRMAGEVSRRTWTKIEPFSIPRSESVRGSQTSPSSSSPPSVMSSRSPASSASFRDSTSTIPAPLPALARLTISGQLPPPLENPFEGQGLSPIVDADSDKASQPEVPIESGVAEDKDQQAEAPQERESLYLLQPVTYTPKLPEPLPSPMIKDYSPPTTQIPEEDRPLSDRSATTIPSLPKRSSLRQRVSLKGNPPESIHIPPPPSALHLFPLPPRSSPRLQPPPPDSAYVSDLDTPHRTGSGTPDFPAPPMRNRTMPSPRSDVQVYHPVQASPHSPLQQRPHTSHTAYKPSSHSTHAPPTPNSAYHPHHRRNAPSRAGGASMLSKVTTMTYDSTTTTGAGTVNGEKRLKKKRSAFGWLKKAFSLDEEEKAAFEARRYAQDNNNNPYHQSRSNKYLDGRRVRPPGPVQR